MASNGEERGERDLYWRGDAKVPEDLDAKKKFANRSWRQAGLTPGTISVKKLGIIFKKNIKIIVKMKKKQSGVGACGGPDGALVAGG